MPALAAFRAVRTKLLDPSQTRLREASFSAGGLSDPDAGHSDYQYYRRAGGARRDWMDALRLSAVERGIKLIDIHPIINRYVTTMTEWIKPSLFKPRCKDERIDRIVQGFWTDARNRFPGFLIPLNWSKLATGELALPARIEPITGRVLIDYWDPADVAGARMAAGSNVDVDSIEFQSRAAGGASLPAVPVIRARGTTFLGRRLLEGRKVSEIQPDVNLDPLAGLSGAFFFRWNALGNSARGRSDFLSGIDSLTMHRELLDACVERANFLARLAGDAEVDGGQPEVDSARAQFSSMPQFASIAFHNKSLKFNMQAPTTNAADSREMERMIRVFGTAWSGLPPTMLGDMTEGNRSVAESAMDPAYLRGESKQMELADVIRTRCQYQVDVIAQLRPAELAGVEDWSIEVETPPLIRRDVAELAPALGAIAGALGSMIADKLIDPTTAREIAVKALKDAGFSGVSLDVVTERLDQAAAAGPLDPATMARYAAMAQEMGRAEGAQPRTEMPPAQPAQRATEAVIHLRHSVMHENCGTGEGGFQPGNDCGGGGGGSGSGAGPGGGSDAQGQPPKKQTLPPPNEKAKTFIRGWATQADSGGANAYVRNRKAGEDWVLGKGGAKADVLDSLYKQTQDTLKERGIVSLKTYRGVALPEKTELFKALRDGRVKAGDVIELDSTHFASYSEDREIATKFAKSNASIDYTAKKAAVVFERIAEPSDVVIGHRVQEGFPKHEKEWVLKNTGKAKVRIVHVKLPGQARAKLVEAIEEDRGPGRDEIVGVFDIGETDEQRGIE